MTNVDALVQTVVRVRTWMCECMQVLGKETETTDELAAMETHTRIHIHTCIQAYTHVIATEPSLCRVFIRSLSPYILVPSECSLVPHC